MSNINYGCSDFTVNSHAECSAAIEQKYFYALSKKGMATKAFIKNVSTGNNKNLKKQIEKGTVKIINP